MTSLRSRLTRGLVVGTTVLVVCAGAGLYLYVRAALLREFDDALHAKARGLGSLVRTEHDGRYDLDLAEHSLPEYLPSAKPEYFQILRGDGTTLARSSSLKGGELLGDPVDGVGIGAAHRVRGHVWNMRLPDGRAGRAFAYSAIPQPEMEPEHQPPTPSSSAEAVADAARPMLVVVARDRAAVDRTLTVLLSSLATSVAALGIATFVAVRLIVSRGLWPVRSLAEEAAAIGPESLDHRFAVESMPDELRPICGRLNDLLERLGQAFRRERRLTADVAHELRTPIAELRALAEVALRLPHDPIRTADYLRDARQIALQMESMVDTILALGRAQSRASAPALQPLALAPLVGSVWARLTPAAEARGLRADFDVPEELTVLSDRLMLSMVLENLFSNAVSYAPPGGDIRCRATAGAGGLCTLAISNTNDSLAQEDLGRLFEPFWRKQASRSDGAHVGLGLSLVAEYTRQLGITVEPRLEGGDFFEMSLRMPISPPQGPETPAPATRGDDRVAVSIVPHDE